MISIEKNASLRAALGLLVAASSGACSADPETRAPEPVGKLGEELTTICPFRQTPVAAPGTFSGANVRALLVRGSRVYIGGSFSFTYNNTTYNNLIAFDLPWDTQAPPTVVTGFRPQPNGSVRALATDGQKLYIGGDFTTINGTSRRRLAAVNVDSGAVDATFTARICCTGNCSETSCAGGTGVRALAITPDGGALVIGGNFAGVKDIPRTNIAAVDKTSGAVSTSRFTTGATGGEVTTLVSRNGGSFSGVFMGGAFTDYQGHGFLVATDSSGSANGGVFATDGNPVISVDVDPGGEGKLFAGLGGSGNKVRAFVASGVNQGLQLWETPIVQGDVQAVHYVDGGVYFGFHDGMFVNGTYPNPGDVYKLASVSSTSSGVAQFMFSNSHPGGPCNASNPSGCWAPKMDPAGGTTGFFGLWAITSFKNSSNSPRLMIGGEFTQVSTISPTKFFTSFSLVP